MPYNTSTMYLKYIFSPFVLNNKKIFFNHKGFSLIELIISVGAISVFAIMVQSMLVLGHAFIKSQQNFFDSVTISATIKKHMCVSNSVFKSINLDESRSYSINPVNPIDKKDKDGNDYTVYERKYEILNNTQPTTNIPIVALNIEGAISETSTFQLFNTQNITEVIKNSPYGAGPPDNPTYYKIYQDSHTTAKFNIGTDGTSIASGHIFTSRCIRNHLESIYDKHPSGSTFTFDPDAQKQSAIHILENLEYRPYYFPRTATEKRSVECCQDGANRAATCKKIGDEGENWVPRIYVIHFDPIDPENLGSYSPYPNSPDEPTPILGKITHIQELPEMQELNNIWGMGFMLSMDPHKYDEELDQTAFQIDIMILKNICSSSVSHIQRCADLSLGVEIATQELTGMTKGDDAPKMKDFIIPDVSNCSGYSRGVGQQSLISIQN